MVWADPFHTKHFPAVFFQDAITLWLQGGYLMWPLAALALVIYYAAFELFFYFARCGFNRHEDSRWQPWLRDPEKAQGEIGRIIRYCGQDATTLRDIRNRFAEVRNAQLTLIDRRVRFLIVLVSAAPLTGLLGTVAGMLATFAGLSVSAGGRTTDLVAAGISQALITTQTGLMIAIPGYILIYAINRRRNTLAFLLSHLESLMMKQFKEGHPA